MAHELTTHPECKSDQAAESVRHLERLVDTGLLLASERDPGRILQAALLAGRDLCGAAFGTFLPSETRLREPSDHLLPVSHLGGSRFRHLPRTRPEAAFAAPAFSEEGVLRSADVTGDLRYDWGVEIDEATTAMPLPSVRSYLAVPVRRRGGGVFGALLYGHSEADVFRKDVEPLLLTLAAQTAGALENARLAQQLGLADAARADQRVDGLRLLHALQAAQMGTWSWSVATGLIDFDERGAELFGVQPRVPLPRDSLRQHLIHGEDMAFAAKDLRELAFAGRAYNTEYRLAVPEGGGRWLAVRGNPSCSPDGEVQGMIGTVQDITPRKTQEEALRISEKLAATGRLAATIAHEINNPLEAVTNLIYLAKTDPEAPESIKRMLEIADGELARVSQIAQHTLGFYRDTSIPVQIDLNVLLKAVVELFERKLGGRRLQCTLDLQPGLSVMGLQGEIRQVVSNLLVNAIDASPAEGGRIHIRGRHCRRAGEGGVAFLVCDQGLGIPHHVRRRLFTPFVTTKESSGTGLGLWVTRGMVEKHGGSVSFRSRTESPTGTVFRVYLPQSGAPTLFASPGVATIQ